MEAQQQRVLHQGLVAGFVAYLAVVVLFAAINGFSGHGVFDTAQRLGAAVVGDGVAPAGQVIAYNGLHLGFMLGLGMVSAWLVHEWELHSQLWYAVFFVLTVGAIVLTLLVGIFATEFAHAVQWHSVVIANLIAAGVMAVYLVLTSHLEAPPE